MKDRLGMIVNCREGRGGSMDQLDGEGGGEGVVEQGGGGHSISCVQGDRGHGTGKEAAKDNLGDR